MVTIVLHEFHLSPGIKLPFSKRGVPDMITPHCPDLGDAGVVVCKSNKVTWKPVNYVD